ncbi:MAG: YqzL-like protein [Bacillales bacterium]|jgi:hypothetical protein|nr:YqzL-like protein [Bacillales bacterium]
MLDFTWKVFSKTGSIDSYLLYKELERENNASGDQGNEANTNEESPII